MKKPLQLLTKYLITSVLSLIPLSLSAQDSAVTEKPSRQQVALQRAELNLAKITKKIQFADSLIVLGNNEYLIAEEAIDQNNASRKIMDKEYTQKWKVLTKQSLSKDKEVATVAKAEIKVVDAAYKSAAKESDLELRQHLKKIDNAQRNLEKGLTTRKANAKKLKPAKKAVAAASKNMNAPILAKRK